MKLKPYPEYKESGVPWLGKVPGHWEIHRNGQIFREIVDIRHPNLELLSMTITNGIVKQSSTGRKTRASEDRNQYKRIKPGDIGYNLMNAFFGGVGVSIYEGLLSPAYAVCRPRKTLEPWYYHHLFRSPIYQAVFNSFSYGIMYERNRLYFERFKLIYSPQPPIEEQQQIVRYLKFKSSQISRFIRAKKRMIELLKEQKQTIINDAVTGKIDVRTGKPYPKYKESGAEWLGKVPEGWEVFRVKQCARTISKGTTPSTEGRELLESGPVRFIKAENIVENEITDVPLCFIDEETHLQLVRSQLQEKDVLFVIAGATLGKIAIVPKSLLPVNTNQAVAFIRPNQHVLSDFLASWLQSGIVRRKIWLAAVQSAQPNLSMGNLGNIQMPRISLDLQQQILRSIRNRTENFDLAISRTKREISLIQEYRTRLIADVVTGKIDVRGIEVPDVQAEDSIEETASEAEEFQSDDENSQNEDIGLV